MSQLSHRAALWLLAASMCGCQPSNAGAAATRAKPEAASAPVPIPLGKQHALTIYGYNYTSQPIADFSVNGTGGGDISVSTPTSSGGGGVCCAAWRDDTPLPTKIHLRWAADACEFTTKPNTYGETFDAAHNIFRETDVELRGPVPQNAGYFEVHFYPDGHVEVTITAESSSPRLLLPANREKPMRRCSAEDWKENKK